MRPETQFKRGPLSAACLRYLIILAALSACSPVAPLRPTTAVAIGAMATMPAITSPLATQGAAPTSAAPEPSLQPPVTENFAAATEYRMEVADQSSEVDTSHAGWWSIRRLGPVGQMFRPSFAGLDAVELWTEDQWDADCSGPGTRLQVRIREATIDGPLVGSSNPAVLPDCYRGVTFFGFPSLVTLTPDKVYVAEVVVALGDNWGVVWQQVPDSYPRGQSIVRAAAGGADIWFREGLRRSTPLTDAYCQNNLWNHVRRSDGDAFGGEGDCIQYVNTGR